MKIVKTAQPKSADPTAPKIFDPVVVTLDVPVFYYGENGAIPSMRGIVCSRVFATTVLQAQEDWAKKYGFGICHIGVLVVRAARGANGVEFVPKRWSNHAHGLGEDFKGIIVNGNFMGTTEMRESGCPRKFQELLDDIKDRIVKAGRRPEIVIEPSWVHAGLWPK